MTLSNISKYRTHIMGAAMMWIMWFHSAYIGKSEVLHFIHNSGFYGVDRGLCDVSHQISDCCCTTQRAIDGVNYNMATQFCALGNTIQSGIRDVIDNQNANYRGLMDFMVSEKLASKDARIAELTNQLSQSNQNAVIRAAIDASTAEIIRRTGNDCPVPSYLVQPPTPVNFPLNGCGTVQFGGGYNGGCGCGCN